MRRKKEKRKEGKTRTSCSQDDLSKRLDAKMPLVPLLPTCMKMGREEISLPASSPLTVLVVWRLGEKKRKKKEKMQ